MINLQIKNKYSLRMSTGYGQIYECEFYFLFLKWSPIPKEGSESCFILR